MLKIPQDAVFTYSITETPDSAFAHSRELVGSLFLNTTEHTDVLECTSADAKSQVVVIGVCVDAHGELARDEIPALILDTAIDEGAERAYVMCDRFAGKYVVYAHINGEGTIWADATCSMSVFYSSKKSVVACGVSENLVAHYVGDDSRVIAGQIAANAPSGQPLPGDVTSFDHVRILLPNHVLNLRTHTAKRIWHSPLDGAHLSADQIADRSLELLKNIYRQYEKYYDLLCPLTVGYDSRINFALMKQIRKSPECFTFKHPSFTDHTPDLKGARELCETYGVEHRTVEDSRMEESEKNRYKSLIGRDATDYSLDLACTIKKTFGRRAILNGNIIDQIGKSVTGNSIPEALAGPRFMRSRIYNHGAPALRVLKPYVRSVHEQCAGHVFDVLTWEQDCCRWATQSDITYGICGVNMLTVSNCRELILLWLSIPRKQRVHKIIHEELFRRLDPRLLSFDFTPESALKRTLRVNWPLFYVSCFAYGFLVAKRSS